MSRYTLIGPDAKPYRSAAKGTLGGHRRTKVYGRLDCAGAAQWIAKGHYVAHRVFFADEATALAAGFRPCARCLPERYAAWKASEMTVALTAKPPFDAAHLIGFLAARAVPGVEEVEGAAFRRAGFALEFGGGASGGATAVRGGRGGGGGAAEGATHGRAAATLTARGDVADAVRRARAMLDVDADPKAIRDALGADPILGPLVAARPGLRSPGAFDAYEVAIRAVVGQQVSVAGARTVLGRLAERGLFPQRDALAQARPEDLPMPRTRANALIEIAQGRPLDEIRGVGPWTLAYVRMRTGDPDVFLPTDLVVRKALERLGGDPHDHERWRPFRSYAVHHLWTAST